MEQKIGILTGGGDCPGLNAVIRAVSMTAHKMGFKVVGFLDGFEGLYDCQTTPLDSASVDHILALGGTILGTSNIGHFSCPLSEEVIKKSKENFEKMGLSCVVAIGGDGTMTIAYQLSLHGIPVVGVPKTIDNDLSSTDQTFGFDSAVSVVTEALDRLHTTAASHHRVMVVEVMGRNAGWIALHSGVAGRANIILLPEIKWNWESIIQPLQEKAKHHKMANYSIVVVAEGASIPEGDQISSAGRLGGVGQLVAAEITKRSGLESRVVVLGHVQRGGSPTSYDRILGTRFGTAAATLACTGEYGKMVSLRGREIQTVQITKEMQIQRLIDPKNDQLVAAARLTGVVFGDELPSTR